LKLPENYCPGVWFSGLLTVADSYEIRSERVIKSGMVAIIRIPSWKLIFVLLFMEFPAFNGIQNSLQYKGVLTWQPFPDTSESRPHSEPYSLLNIIIQKVGFVKSLLMSV
jgi:hypothetical protein